MQVDALVLALYACVDEPWYLEQYPDVASSGRRGARHFVEQGWREGRAPNAYFDTGWYAEQYPAVREDDLNPLEHYLRWGWREGRHPHPAPAVRAALDQARQESPFEVCPLLLLLSRPGSQG